MKALNLYIITRNIDNEFYTQYENVLSGRNKVQKVKDYEFDCLVNLVELLLKNNVNVPELDGFYYSYTINHIGKEFDLLKIYNKEIVLNIELKSESISEVKIKDQLVKNKYYLNHIAPKIFLFTFIKETDNLYVLDKDILRLCKIDELIQVLKIIKEYEESDIDYLFNAKDFLISPLNTPNKFIGNIIKKVIFFDEITGITI